MEDYQTGYLMRLWRETHPQRQGHTEVRVTPHRTVLQIAAPLEEKEPTTDHMETTLLPAVQLVKPVVIVPPPYIEYRSVDNPLTMLYGACVAFAQRHKRLPEVLYISPLLVPILEYQTKLVNGREYAGRFYIFSANATDGRTECIPVGTEEELPDILKLAIGGGSIGRDSVIAASEK